MARPLSYIGITGFTSPAQILELLSWLDASELQSLWGDRQLMVGVLVSSKTMRGEANKWPGRYPPSKALPNIFTADPRCLNILHFNTDQPATLALDMVEIMRLAGPNCHGIQLNIRWPDMNQLRVFRQTHSFARVILQLGKGALEEVLHNPDAVALRLKEYADEGLITDVLHDMSGGEGVFASQEIDRAAAILDAIERTCPQIGIGFAGGLHAGNLHRVVSLFNEFPNVSIDAEGQLRTPVADKYRNCLDQFKAYAYMMVALNMFAPEPAPVPS